MKWCMRTIPYEVDKGAGGHPEGLKYFTFGAPPILGIP